ncbi:hypothetical protein [Streptomyces sp. NPDC014733]|uniref:hypothetical protein n=1 Tax=Streptomyces sp. NPDC014733 TaxID=3364885 RepID=UPI0036F53910
MSGAWWARAPCAGDVRFAPALPAPARDPTMLALLEACGTCQWRAQCIARVRPRRSRFDGICGGRLWRDGKILASCEDATTTELAEGAAPIAHGTEAGARTHRRRGQRPCAACLEAQRVAQMLRRDKKPT